MPAYVVERAELLVCSAHDQQRLADQLRRKVVAGLRDLIAVPHHLPGSREDAVLFLGCYGRIQVEFRRKRPGPRNFLRNQALHGADIVMQRWNATRARLTEADYPPYRHKLADGFCQERPGVSLGMFPCESEAPAPCRN